MPKSPVHLRELERPIPPVIKTRFVCPDSGRSLEFHAGEYDAAMIVNLCGPGGHTVTALKSVSERIKEWSE